MNKLKLKRSLEDFFIEDIGDHDLTSDILFPLKTEGEIIFTSKQSGVFCGTEVIQTGYELLDSDVHVDLHIKDGADLTSGDLIATASGSMASLLKGERVILNLIQRMSGVATNTREAIRVLDCDHTRICDTRKTTPGLRMLEKYAVRTGGGSNHRNGLYDAVMLKDNHIAFAGSVSKAVEKVKAELGHMVKIEVETEEEAQVKEAVEAGVDCIMFDNCHPDQIKTLVEMVPSSITTEASGGITLANLASYSGLGVDYISLGFLTHSVISLDISANVVMK